jgi:predicted component of type VI protein secretion system
MALELRIAGPGIDVSRRVEEGEAPLILGRDPECAVCLPDPEKNVSRKHLSVWNEAGRLQFLVVSVVNGVELPSGEVAPGGRGMLAAGETLRIAEYSVVVAVADDEEPTVPPGVVPPVAAAGTVAAAPAGGSPSDDPWDAFEGPQEFAPTQPAPFEAAPAADADPFGDWGFDTFGETPGAGATLQASGLAVASDVSAFFQGLGMDPDKVGVLSQGELEAMGRLVRMAVLGLIELHKSVSGSRQQIRSEDRTMMATRDEKNPLKEGNLSEETLMLYLFGGRAAAAAGYVGPERAMRELVGELATHEKASAIAARALVEGMLREFEPDAVKARLLGGGTRLFESARAWDAFSKDFAEQAEDPAKWVQRLMNKYFTSAYVRESMRMKKEGPGRNPATTR